jgi:NADH-quinone oxidoreductase subunit F
MSQKILLDKINIPGIKTYEVYRQNGVMLSRKSLENINTRRSSRRSENFRIAWSWWSRFAGMKWSFIDKNQENQDI